MDVVILLMVYVVGEVRNSDFPAKKLSFKLPDPAVGTVDTTVKGGGRVPGSTLDPTNPNIFDVDSPKTWRTALEDALLLKLMGSDGITFPDGVNMFAIYFTPSFFQLTP